MAATIVLRWLLVLLWPCILSVTPPYGIFKGHILAPSPKDQQTFSLSSIEHRYFSVNLDEEGTRKNTASLTFAMACDAKTAIIAPSVLAADFADLAAESKKVLRSGANWIHLDVMDGHFVPNISFGAPVVKCLRKHLPKGSAFFDCHLMVSDPEKWAVDFQKAGADQVTFHFEALGNDCDAAVKLAKKLDELGMKAGISIKPKTPVDAVYPALDSGAFHTLLVMTVEPGFGGQSFMPDMMPKVRAARSRYPNLIIEVDGGLNESTAEVVAEAGANAIVAGTSIFNAPSVDATIANMKGSINKHKATW